MNELRRAASRITALEEYALKDSPLCRIHPGVKIFAAAAYIVCAASFSNMDLSGLIPYLLYPAVLLPLSAIPLGALVKRIVPVLPFALMGGIANIIFMKEPAFLFGDLVVSTGVVSFAAILFKAVFCVASVLILIGSTPFHVICAELRRFHVPAVFCLQLSMLYRYITVLLVETSAMFAAYTLRTARKQKSIDIKNMGGFLGHLFLRSIDKSGKVYNAMKCRGGWQGIYYSPGQKIQFADCFFCVIVCGLSVLFRFFNIPEFLGGLLHATFTY
jgi:cobalt/nickel transport system permease protein